jgi:hypothetical protein
MKNNQTENEMGSPKIKDLISLEKAANLSGLTSGHLRLLIRQGNIWGTKIGRNWVTTEQAVKEYQARAKPRGRPKKI